MPGGEIPYARASLLVALVAGAPGCSSSGELTDAGPPDVHQEPIDGPYLTRLAVTSSTESVVTLVPPFAPGTSDYYVRCVPGENRLTVSMAASPGATSGLTVPTASARAETQTLTIGVFEDQAIVATAARGSLSTEYWVRCLPHDFPPMVFTTFPDAGRPPPGYYVLGANDLLLGVRWGYPMIMNADGVPVWYTHGKKVGSRAWDVDNLIPGAISFFSIFGPPVEVHALDPLKTTYAAPTGVGVAVDAHELRVLPDGHFMLFSDPNATEDLSGVTVDLADGGTVALGPKANMAQCDIVEFDPKTGAVTWTWRGLDHLDPVADTTAPEVITKKKSGTVVDTFHCNSIDVEPGTGNLLVSARDMDSVFYVEKKSGKILWKMGGRAATKDGATYVPVNDRFFRQHDARFLAGWTPACGSGPISLFDDHSGLPGPARGVVLDVHAVPSGAGAGCAKGAPGATVSWQYAGAASSSGQGSFRATPDGSRVVGWGINGTNGLVFTEVDAQGRRLAELSFSNGDVSYRVIKVPASAFDLAVLRKAAGRL